MTYMYEKRHTLEVVAVFLAVILPLSVHAGVFSVLFGNVEEKTPEILYPHDSNIQTMPLLKAATHIDPNPAKGGGDILVDEEGGVLVPSGDIDGVDETINVKTANGEISVYIVREGDTLSQIAEMYDVSAKTVLWANNISDPGLIQPGATLVILPITGVRHVVKDGDTLASIAKKYEGDVEDIMAYNQLTESSAISVGDTIVIPDGTIAAPAPSYASPTKTSGATYASGGGSSNFSHPLPGATRTQGIHGYNGVDLASYYGAPVYAAASGQVIIARSSGWNGGYGAYVVIKHPNGTQTLYAHLASVTVSTGQTVAGGATTIGTMGNSGRSTGPHLHFEVRGARNPF